MRMNCCYVSGIKPKTSQTKWYSQGTWTNSSRTAGKILQAKKEFMIAGRVWLGLECLGASKEKTHKCLAWNRRASSWDPAKDRGTIPTFLTIAQSKLQPCPIALLPEPASLFLLGLFTSGSFYLEWFSPYFPDWLEFILQISYIPLPPGNILTLLSSMTRLVFPCASIASYAYL